MLCQGHEQLTSTNQTVIFQQLNMFYWKKYFSLSFYASARVNWFSKYVKTFVGKAAQISSFLH